MSNIHIIVSKKESVRVLRSCISSLESGLGAIYKVQKDKGQLRSLRIFIIRPGAFDQLSELAIKNGTSASNSLIVILVHFLMANSDRRAHV